MTALLTNWFQFMNDQRRELFTDIGLLILRLGFGFFMLAGHGWGKLSNFAERADSFADPIGLGSTVSLALAVFAEFFCSIAIMVGFLTRLALTQLIITMLVAAFIVHLDDPLFGRPGKELALVYLTAYLTLFLAGAGRFSVDGMIANKYRQA